MLIQTAPQTIALWLPGKTRPKARPRFAWGQAYLPSNYREWKQQATLDLLKQLGDRTLPPIARASAEILLIGKYRGNADNMGGAVLDLLVQTGVLVDDRISCVPRLLVEHQQDGEIGAKIKIQELL